MYSRPRSVSEIIFQLFSVVGARFFFLDLNVEFVIIIVRSGCVTCGYEELSLNREDHGRRRKFSTAYMRRTDAKMSPSNNNCLKINKIVSNINEILNLYVLVKILT